MNIPYGNPIGMFNSRFVKSGLRAVTKTLFKPEYLWKRQSNIFQSCLCPDVKFILLLGCLVFLRGLSLDSLL